MIDLLYHYCENFNMFFRSFSIEGDHPETKVKGKLSDAPDHDGLYISNNI
jgi:hypothetical protein